MSPNLLSAHYKLGRRRRPGETLVEVYPSNDPGGFGPAIQIVTDYATLLMDSVTVLLHRLGVAYKAIMNPILRVRRSPAGELLDIRPSLGGRQLTGGHRRGVDSRPAVQFRRPAGRSRRPSGCCPAYSPMRARSRSTRGRCREHCSAWPTNSTPTRRVASRPPTARTSRRCCGGWPTGNFVLLGYQRCPVQDGQSSVDTSSRLGVLRLREEILPQLTDSDDLLVLAQATIPSFLRYGAYPYIVVVREHPGHQAIEHRFVGLFTVAAMNANVTGHSADLATGQRSDRAGAARSEPSGSTAARHHPDHSRAQSCSRSAPASCSTWRRPSSTSARAGGRCCSCAPTSSPTSSPAWSTCRATATPPRCGSRCRTSWCASSAARASTTPPGSANHPGRSCISPCACRTDPVPGMSTSR